MKKPSADLVGLIGQWHGKLAGGSLATILMHFEHDGNVVGGRALIVETDANVVFSYVLSFKAKTTVARGKLDAVLNRKTRLLEDPKEHSELIEKLEIPMEVDAEFTIATPQSLSVTWQTSLGNSGTGDFQSYRAPEWSEKAKNFVSWRDFKSELSGLDRHSWIFRGQSAPWSLRTTFHRRGRFDLIRYALQDVRLMNRILVSSTNQWLDLSNADQHTSLLFLGQHHGYPTPLLDWTKSPYVAAYFAAREPAPVDELGPRIYALDSSLWKQVSYQTSNIQEAAPTITLSEPIPYWNARAVPQQSITTFSNVDNMEKFITEQRGAEGALRWFDFSPDEREIILDDLEWMGVTESSVFPGVEGSFRSLARNRFPQ